MRLFSKPVIIVYITVLFSCENNVESPVPDPLNDSEHPNWTIPKGDIIYRGDENDFIPSIDNPSLIFASHADSMSDDDMIIGIQIDGDFRAYPVSILNYHEIVNDNFTARELMISYCPLTGTSAAWNRGNLNGFSSKFGLSKYNYNSNHILYDHISNSYWLPMVFGCVNGDYEGYEPDSYPLIETTWKNWKNMFPASRVITTNIKSGFNYKINPYSAYMNNDSIYFKTNPIDNRLPLKEKVHGIVVGDRAKVYPQNLFSDSTSLIMDNFQGLSVVVIGSKLNNFIISYERRLPDGPELNFIATNVAPNIVMEDTEGNKYDIFGWIIDGPKKGQSLLPTKSMTGYWFSLASIYPDPIIYLK